MPVKKITIHIDQLGPVRNSDIELKPFMVFTGESGTGKSYTALLVHYVYKVVCKPSGLREFFNYLGASYDEHKKQIEGEEGVLFQFTLQQLENWVSASAVKYVGEMLGNFSLDGKVSINFLGLDDNYQFYYKKDAIEIGDDVEYFDRVTMNGKYTMRFRSDIDNWNTQPYQLLTNDIFRIPQYNTFLLPPSRGGLVCLNDVGRGDYKISPAGMYNEFIEDLGYLKSAKSERILEEVYQPVSKSLLSGKINIRENELFFEQDNLEIPISAGAASIKELAPFAIMLQKGLVEQYSVMFEEPETNLHPELQIKVADTLAYLLQQGCRFQITTHSDYFLQRINQLIKLGKLPHKENDVYIEEDKIAAYYFEKSDNANTTIKPLEIGKNGIPFSTFFDTVKKLSDEENRINNLLDNTYGD